MQESVFNLEIHFMFFFSFSQNVIVIHVQNQMLTLVFSNYLSLIQRSNSDWLDKYDKSFETKHLFHWLY